MPQISPYYVLVEHAVTYTNRDPLPVADVIEMLRGLADISSRFLPRTLNELLDGNDVIGAELYVEGFEEGSFITQALTKLFFRSEQDVLDFCEKLNAGEYREALRVAYQALPGGDKPVGKIAGVSIIVAALVGAGAYYAAHDDPQAQVQINANNNTIIAIGAESYNVSPEDFARVLEVAIGADKKRLAGDAAKVLAPAKHDPDAAVQIAGQNGLVFTPTTVQATPTHPEFGTYEFDQHVPDVDLEIRATDRDSSKRGWGGVIPGLVDRRVRLILADGISIADLADKFVVRADVTVHYSKPEKSGIHKPVAITVERLVTDDPAED